MQNIVHMVLGFLVFTVVLTGAWFVDEVGIEKNRSLSRTVTHDRTVAIRAKLESSLNARLHLVRGLAAFAKTKINFTFNEFEQFTSNLKGGLNGIRSLQLAPNAVVTYISPLKGNEAAKNHNLLADPLRRDAVQRAIDEKRFIIAGPVQLRQGGVALIGRLPVFIESIPKKDIDSKDKFWGLSIILIDLEQLLIESGLADSARDISIAIRGKDGLGANGEVFYGKKTLFNNNPVLLDVTLPNGTWQIAATPINGWPTSWEGQKWFYLSAGLLSISLGILVYFLVRQPAILQRQIELATSQLKLQTTAMEASDNSIVITDKDGIILWANPAFSRISGYVKMEIIGQNIKILSSGLHDEDYFKELWQTILAGRVWRGEITNQRKDGTLYYDDSTITPVRDKSGNISHFIAVKEDITLQKKARQALQESESRLRSIMENVGEGILLADKKGIILHANPAVEDMFGYSTASLIGRNIKILVPHPHNSVHDEYIKKYLTSLQLQNGSIKCDADREAMFFNREIIAKKRNGDDFVLELTVNCILGTPTPMFIALLRDITVRKNTEKELQETRQYAFQQEKMASLGTLAAGIAHEIANPLSAISGLIEHMNDSDSKLDNADIDTLNLVMDSVNRISLILDDVREVSSPQQLDEMTPLSINDIIRIAVRLFKLDSRTKNVHCQLELDSNLSPFLGSEGIIKQVILNLLINSADAIEEASPDKPEIQIITSYENKKFKIIISDNGCGIHQDVIKHIFEPFYTTKPLGKGTGLGLAMCHSYITSHGGDITVYSIPNELTKFEITLPDKSFS
ncbi:MAG: PAS domain S-box protein [Magnetococcales bacterium]|nr:PAS domain S-box protein [Magnetococcales bacterium]